MGSLLNIIAVMLLIGWLVGFFGFNLEGGFIHILLVMAVITIILRVAHGRKPLA